MTPGIGSVRRAQRSLGIGGPRLVPACTRQVPPKLANSRNTRRRSSPSIPGTSWVVQVKTVKKVTRRARRPP
jgi:hypothetical protein